MFQDTRLCVIAVKESNNGLYIMFFGITMIIYEQSSSFLSLDL